MQMQFQLSVSAPPPNMHTAQVAHGVHKRLAVQRLRHGTGLLMRREVDHTEAFSRDPAAIKAFISQFQLWKTRGGGWVFWGGQGEH